MTEKLSAKTNAKTTPTRLCGREVSMKESTPSTSKPARDNGFLERSDCKELEAACGSCVQYPISHRRDGNISLEPICLGPGQSMTLKATTVINIASSSLTVSACREGLGPHPRQNHDPYASEY